MFFFDLAGEKRWHFFYKYLIKKAHGAIFTFDLIWSPSLENTSQWVEICRTKNPELPILMIGAKADLEEYGVQIEDELALIWKDKKFKNIRSWEQQSKSSQILFNF